MDKARKELEKLKAPKKEPIKKEKEVIKLPIIKKKKKSDFSPDLV